MAQKKYLCSIVPRINSANTPAIVPVSQPDTARGVSLFKNNLLDVKSQKPQIHFTGYDYVLALILFVSYIIYVWIYVANRKRLNLLIRGFYFNRSSSQLSREDYSASNRMGVLLSLIFIFTISLFAGQVIDYYGIAVNVSKTVLYLLLSGGLVLMYLLKVVTIRLSGFIFKTGKEASDYIATLFLFINILALFMLPVVTCLAFVSQVPPYIFIYTGYAVIIGFLCIRLVRGMMIGFNSSRVSKFYLFLYLCTLEIVPFILLVKLFMLFV